MRIWVDADACPATVKDTLFRAARRTQVPVTLIANAWLRVPPSPYIRALQVPAGFDVADQRIVESARAGDLVITADIPLAALVIANGARVIDPRGDLLDGSNIQDRLSMRDLMAELRTQGAVSGGPAAYSAADLRAFANRLDALLAARPRPPIASIDA